MFAEARSASKSPSTLPTIAPATPTMLPPVNAQAAAVLQKSRRPKPGTSRAATVRDEGDPAKGAHAPLLKLDRDDRERDG